MTQKSVLLSQTTNKARLLEEQNETFIHFNEKIAIELRMTDIYAIYVNARDFKLKSFHLSFSVSSNVVFDQNLNEGYDTGRKTTTSKGCDRTNVQRKSI